MENNPVETVEVGHEEESTLYAPTVFHIGNFPITTAMMSSFFVLILIIALAFTIRASIRKVPGKLQSFFEILYTGALDLAVSITGDKKLAQKLLPLSIGVFFFVLLNNWIGLLPLGFLTFSNSIGHAPILRSATADINTTLAIALISVIGANIFGAFSIGLWKTVNKYVNISALAVIPRKVKRDPSVLMMAPITFFVGVLELVGEGAKIASLSFRLFGNVFAGEVLLAAMASILPFILPVPFLFLEVMVGVIQALIFAVLVLVYFYIGSQDHSDHDEHEEKHAHA